MSTPRMITRGTEGDHELEEFIMDKFKKKHEDNCSGRRAIEDDELIVETRGEAKVRAIGSKRVRVEGEGQ